MEQIIDYFSGIPSSHRSAILVGGLAFFWLIEGVIPLFRFQYKKWQHAGINIFFTITTVLVNLAFAFLILQTSDWTVANNFGLLHIITMPTWVFGLLGLLGLDLIGAYLIHWLQHQVKVMWKFHLIHHSDIYVDTTTANRHHPGESVLRAVFTLLGVFVLGTPMWLVMMYQSLSVVFSQFNHANIILPEKLDKWLSWIIVSPNMHKVHHHESRPLTDTNYGNIFAIWDRIFGTYVYAAPQSLKYGIDTHPDEREHSSIKNLLEIPFQEYRQPPN